MKNLIRSIILLAVFFNCTFLLYSQDINPVGKYQLRHNIPKEAFNYNDDSIFFYSYVDRNSTIKNINYKYYFEPFGVKPDSSLSFIKNNKRFN